jgi:hypothetical protein
MTPVESNKWLEKNMLPLYPLGDIKVEGTLVQHAEKKEGKPL